MRNTQLTDQCLTKLPKLVDLVLEKHEYQIKKWGVRTCTSFEWGQHLCGATRILSETILEHRHRDGSTCAVVDEAIQTATLCLKIAEMYLDLEDEDA